MTTSADGDQIMAMAGSVVDGINGGKGQAAGALADAIQYLMQAKAAAEDPTQQVAQILGEDHPGTNAIVGNTAVVSESIESMVAMIEGAINQLEGVSGAADQLAWVYNNVGGQIKQAGGAG